MKITLRVMSAAAMALLAGALLPMSFAAESGSKSVAPGAKWEVARTTALSELTVGEGASITAPAGHSVTMTVDGVETDIEPGTYNGKIVLTVADAIGLKANSPMQPSSGPGEFKTAIFVNDGKYVPSKSVPAAVASGEVTDAGAKNLKIISKGEMFNGVIVAGDSKYTLDNPDIYTEGMGGSDMTGWGAGVMATGKADLTLNHAHIVTKGVIRNAIFVGGNSTVHVNDSTIEAYTGATPKNLPVEKGPGAAIGASSYEAPWVLGVSGNVRATNVVENGTVYYNNSHIKSQGWGALSTDGPTHIRMYVTDSTIETVESGYGAFTIGDCLDTFSHDTFNVADVGVIVTGYGSVTITDGTVMNSRRFGFLMHTNDGKFGTVKIDKGSEINSRSATFMIKGRGVKIDVDNAKLNPGNGILIDAVPNDDPLVGGYGTRATVDAMLDGTPGSEKISRGGGPGGGAPSGAPGGAPGGGAAGGAPAPGGGASGAAGGWMSGASGGGGAGGGGGAPGGLDYDDSGGRMSGPVLATFKDVNLLGDIVNARTNQGGMEITLQNSSLHGAITTAVAEAASHKKVVKKLYFMVSEMKNVYQPTKEKYGLKVSLDGSSKWTIDQTSYLTSLEVANGATISTPDGFLLKMTVDGVEKPIQAGSYSGKIVLSVTPEG